MSNYQNPQGRIEGFEVTEHRARFSGWWEVTDDDDQAVSLDRVVVMIVAARSEGVTFKITEDGDVLSGRVLRVNDAVPLVGDSREEAIQMLADHRDPNQMRMSFQTPGSAPDPSPDPAAGGPQLSPSLVNSPPAGVDTETGAIDDDEEHANIPTSGSSTSSARVEANGDSDPDTVGQVGSIYDYGHTGRDKTLARFLGEDLR